MSLSSLVHPGIFEAYVESFSQAVERFTDEEVRSRPDLFTYRRADLTNAARRALFFRFFSDQRYWTLWRGSDGAPRFRRGVEAKLAKHVVDLARLPGRVHLEGAGAVLSRIAKRLRPYHVRRALEPLADALRPRSPDDGATRSRPALFLAPSAKFMRYLEPIRRALSPPGVFFSDWNHALDSAAAADGLPVLSAPKPLRRLRLPGSARHLNRFGGIADRADGYADLFAAHRPRVVVLAEGTGPEAEVASRVARSLNVPTVCVQHGYPGSQYRLLLEMSYDRILVWGRGFLELYAPHVPPDVLRITGSHVLAREANSGSPGRSITFYLQYPNFIFVEDAQERLLSLVERVARTVPNESILVRPHPSHSPSAAWLERFAALQNVELVLPGEVSLPEVFARSRLSVGVHSTVLLEGAAAGIPVLALNLTRMDRLNPHVGDLGVGRVVADEREALALLSGPEASPDALRRFDDGIRRFQEDYFDAGHPEPPLDRIVRSIDEVTRRAEAP